MSLLIKNRLGHGLSLVPAFMAPDFAQPVSSDKVCIGFPMESATRRITVLNPWLNAAILLLFTSLFATAVWFSHHPTHQPALAVTAAAPA